MKPKDKWNWSNTKIKIYDITGEGITGAEIYSDEDLEILQTQLEYDIYSITCGEIPFYKLIPNGSG